MGGSCLNLAAARPRRAPSPGAARPRRRPGTPTRGSPPAGPPGVARWEKVPLTAGGRFDRAARPLALWKSPDFPLPSRGAPWRGPGRGRAARAPRPPRCSRRAQRSILSRCRTRARRRAAVATRTHTSLWAWPATSRSPPCRRSTRQACARSPARA